MKEARAKVLHSNVLAHVLVWNQHRSARLLGLEYRLHKHALAAIDLGKNLHKDALAHERAWNQHQYARFGLEYRLHKYALLWNLNQHKYAWTKDLHLELEYGLHKYARTNDLHLKLE